jgi:hypothetical protein
LDDVWKGLTLLVAGGVAYVAFQQYRLSRERFKLDLFEKRFSVFAATRKLLSIILTEANLSLAQLFDYRAAVAEATFLFDADITNYLDEIDKKALRFHYTNERMRQTPPVEDRPKIVDENLEILTWLTDQLPQLKGRFAPYLKFHVWN